MGLSVGGIAVVEHKAVYDAEVEKRASGTTAATATPTTTTEWPCPDNDELIILCGTIINERPTQQQPLERQRRPSPRAGLPAFRAGVPPAAVEVH
jgi:hypothetical protein